MKYKIKKDKRNNKHTLVLSGLTQREAVDAVLLLDPEVRKGEEFERGVRFAQKKMIELLGAGGDKT